MNLYDAVTPAKRHTCLAYFNVLNGAGVGLGALVGGTLLAVLPAGSISAFALVFVVSTVLRVGASLGVRLAVREVRPVERVGFRQAVLDLVGQRLIAVLGALPGRSGRSGRSSRDA